MLPPQYATAHDKDPFHKGMDFVSCVGPVGGAFPYIELVGGQTPHL